ncbi:hypothetical protein AB0M54_46005 [Actinoplanes sp. NPDC051470]|uniref:hypothetical protein n=1 Tax=Actinoplanes sp. NPDC051470 TaxID=3157224 RepID=UPI00341C76F1
MRFLSGREAVLKHIFETDDEAPLTPVAVTVTVTREGRTTAATSGTAIRNGDVYTFAAGSLPLGVYTVRWDGGTAAVDTSWFEVVGGHLFTVAEVRAYDADLSADRFPTSAVVRLRDYIAGEFESITGRSFVTRCRRIPVELDGSCSPLPLVDVQATTFEDSAGQTVYAVSVEPVGPFTLAEGEGSYTAELTYGFRSVPDDVKRAALLRIRTLLFAERSGIPDRATSFQPAEGGTYTLATPGVRGSETGIPDVDAVLGRYGFDVLDDLAGVLL